MKDFITAQERLISFSAENIKNDDISSSKSTEEKESYNVEYK